MRPAENSTPFPQIRQGSRALRRHRYSVPGHAYLVTSPAAGRAPLFADFTLACRVAAAMGGAGRLRDANVMAWVLMPDHAHWLVQLGHELPLAGVVQRLKSLTARAAERLHGGGAVWQPGYHERALRDEADWRPATRYLVRNPLRAGLCQSVWDYPFWDACWLVPGEGGHPVRSIASKLAPTASSLPQEVSSYRKCITMYDMAVLTIRIPDELESQLDRQSRALGVSKSDLARDALKRHLAVREFRELRAKAVPVAMAQGIFTDDDVFVRIGTP